MTNNTTGTTLTCIAESDGGTTTVSKTFRVDKTAPATTATPSRSADSNGWYNHDVAVDFNGSDTTSGLESCSPDATYSGPDTSGTTVAGTCRDIAGNTAPATLPLKYDETAPQTSPAARPPDANGWHNHAVTVTFQGTDGTSGVATCTQTTYSGPDDPSVALTGTCVDQAGNQSPSALFTTKYDETPPQATATVSRPADVNGWHNHPLTVGYAGSDATSGLASCDPSESYAGPDSASATISGACRDLAGNVAPRSVVVKYDATAPQVTSTPARAANAAGWYNAPLAVAFAGTDPMSASPRVSSRRTRGTDSATAAVPGSCSDQAGNVRNASFGLKYDATAPQTNRLPGSRRRTRTAGTTPLCLVHGLGYDVRHRFVRCGEVVREPDTASASLGGTCRDRAGNRAAAVGFKYDATARGHGGAVPAAERQRLVPGAAHGRLHRRRRNVRAQLVRGREELRRPGCRRLLCRRHLPRSGRKHGARRSGSSTTRRPRWRRRRRPGNPTPRAGSTQQSRSASRRRMRSRRRFLRGREKLCRARRRSLGAQRQLSGQGR